MRTREMHGAADLRQVLRELAAAAAGQQGDDVSLALRKLVALDTRGAVNAGIHAVDPTCGDMSAIPDWQEWVHCRMDSASSRLEIVRMAYAALDAVSAVRTPGEGQSL